MQLLQKVYGRSCRHSEVRTECVVAQFCIGVSICLSELPYQQSFEILPDLSMESSFIIVTVR